MELTLTIQQGEFVLSRKSYVSKNDTEVYGVCGRDLKAWRMLIDDLSDESTESDKLAESLLSSIKVESNIDMFKELCNLLNSEQEKLTDFMNKDGTHLKLAFIL